MKDIILQGDCLETLKTLEDESVDSIITSPPYYGLRDYGTAKWEGGDKKCNHKGKPLAHQTSIHERTQPQCNNKPDENTFEIYKDVCKKCGAKRVDQQLGLEKSLNEYLDRMLKITLELRRVLKKTGTMWWNHGDSYAGSGKGYGDKEADTKFKSILRGGGTARSRTLRPEKSKIPPKSLMLQAYRLAIRMVDEQGWVLRNQIVWHKPNVMPSSVKDRFTVDFEPIFFFSKSKKYWFEPQYEPYTEPMNRWGGDKLKADGKSEWDGGTGQDTYRDRDMRPNKLGRNKRSVWKIATKPFKEAHFATFPETLIEIPIKAGCPEFVCEQCGQAREKVWRTEYVKNRPSAGNDKRSRNEDRFTIANGTSGFRGNNLLAQRTSQGYNDCECNAGFVGGWYLIHSWVRGPPQS